MAFCVCYTSDGGGIDNANGAIIVLHFLVECPVELEAAGKDTFDGGSGGFRYVPEEDYVGRC